MNTIDEIVREVGRTAGYVSRNVASHAGSNAGTNPSGDDQVGADIWADGLFYDAVAPLDGVGGYASEERETVDDCGDGYTIAIDPLDGSSNVSSNNPVGTILGVYDAELPASGRHLVASVMVLYGPYTTMAVTREDRGSVQEFLLRDGHSERRRQLTVPDDPTVVGLAGKPTNRSERFNAFASELEGELKLRYGGATVADLSQVLEYGGLFGYPETSRYPGGKLRVHFESAPLAHIVEEAGGGSSDGTGSLLDVDPDGVHGRAPTFLGTANLIDRLEDALGDG